jgi:uroporphyrinogen-III synthase
VRLLVTRPEPDGERTAEKLRARGCHVVLVSLLRTETMIPDLGAGPWGALVITSANAARAIEQHPRRGELMRLPLFAVGGRTASCARAIGFGNVASADGNQADLVRRIVAEYRDRAPLLYLAGEDRSGDLVGDLAAHGLDLRIVVVYRATKVVILPPEAHAALAASQIDGVLHYSRRSAEAYLDCAQAAGILDRALAPVHYCLSRQVAEPLLAAGARTVRTAPAPDENGLINLVVA